MDSITKGDNMQPIERKSLVETLMERDGMTREDMCLHQHADSQFLIGIGEFQN